METFTKPKKSEFTIYSKSGCPNCMKSKTLLHDNFLSFSIVDCDEYLLENRDEFLMFINKLAGKDIKQFPMIFDCNKYVGGYEELIEYVNNFQNDLNGAFYGKM